MPRGFGALQIDFVANVQILWRWPFLLQLFCLESAYLSPLLLVGLTHPFSSRAYVLIFHMLPHNVYRRVIILSFQTPATKPCMYDPY